ALLRRCVGRFFEDGSASRRSVRVADAAGIQAAEVFRATPAARRFARSAAERCVGLQLVPVDAHGRFAHPDAQAEARTESRQPGALRHRPQRRLQVRAVMPFRRLSVFNGTLRSKFLLSLTLITALITSAVLMIVQYRVRIHVREGSAQAMRDSVVTFQSLQQQRESMLERSTALLAALPPLKAVMTSQDPATIQDASTIFWQLAGSQVFVLADRAGKLAAFHTATPGFTTSAADSSIKRYLAGGESHDWWFGGGHLFQVFLEPIYFGSPDSGHPIGILAVGYEIDAS